MIDVDNFKAFNDRYGHQSGDAVLTSIAQAVDAATLRPRDVAARYGGEEFAVVLPGIDAVSALHVAERIRLAVIELAIPHAGGAAHVASVSIGIATAAPMSFDDRTAIIEGADAALYEAKRLGRNRSCSSSAIAGRTQSAKSIVIPESA
jgi:diguanylate cyclase (GGDEF)-like protein